MSKAIILAFSAAVLSVPLSMFGVALDRGGLSWPIVAWFLATISAACVAMVYKYSRGKED